MLEKDIDYYLHEMLTTKEEIEKRQREIKDKLLYLENCTTLYRVKSVDRVLDFIRHEYRAGRICNIENLLCHCQNKLNGNIDRIELDLAHHRGVPFEKLLVPDEAKTKWNPLNPKQEGEE